jgi:hypothetical protein
MEKCASNTSAEKYPEGGIADGVTDNLPKEPIVPLAPMERQIALQAALKIDPGVKRWAWPAIQASNTSNAFLIVARAAHTISIT